MGNYSAPSRPLNFSTAPIGILRRGFIQAINPSIGSMTVKIDTTATSFPVDAQNAKFVQIPFAFYSAPGIFVGGYPAIGTPVIIGQGESTNWYFVSFLVSNFPTLPDFNPGEFLIQAGNNTKIVVNDDDEITIGGLSSALYLNTSASIYNNKSQSSFSNQFSFTEASRATTGVVKREVLTPQSIYDYQKLTFNDYDTFLTPIGLDPTSTTVVYSQMPNKNPPFVEKRELIYEFTYSSQVQDDVTEAAVYSLNQQQPPPITPYSLPNRRYSKADTLSLSLVSPNYLMETTKGTVVDIFGNVLDLNRNPIVGYGQEQQSLSLSNQSIQSTTSSPSNQSAQSVVFEAIKAAERRSIAFHFELNARKDLSAGNGQFQLPNINSSIDYARPRSRMFFDMDKEGQFKLNVPASSETGNVPTFVRYENYSTFGTEDNNNPNKLIYLPSYLDIFSDSFSTQDITINNATGVATPVDRLTNQNIMLGTPFHSIKNSGYAFTTANTQPLLDYQWVYQAVDTSTIPTLDNVVSDTITAGGTNANAGGRSGTANFDGSLVASIGANTIDRQSLWLDTAGSIIANIGRDMNMNSAVVSLDGNMMVQIGGFGVTTDSRFATQNNTYVGGALDIRVLNAGFTMTMIRIDSNGVAIMCPSKVVIEGRDIVIAAQANMTLNAENLYIQNRLVNLAPLGNSI